MSSRPSSSASVRTSTSASGRSLPTSRSASVSRKTPTGASRPTSRATQRPGSRHARPPSRHSTRIQPLCQDLVTTLTGLSADVDRDEFETKVDMVSKTLDPTVRPAGSIDLTTIQAHLRGHAQKARITSHDILATALDRAQQSIRTLASNETDLDAEINMSRLPNHVQFLLALATPPDRNTLDRAAAYVDRLDNPDKPPPGLSWAEILAEEPFSGEHWKGVYGMPPGSVIQDNDNDDAISDDSLASLSLLHDDLDLASSSSSESDHSYATFPDDGFSLRVPPPPATNDDDYMQQWSKEIENYRYRSELEHLQARQYWRSDWRMSPHALSQPFNIGHASSLGPAFRKIHDPAGLAQTRYINEHDAVREVLMALQGRNNLMLSWQSTGDQALSFVPDPKAPSLLHLTPAALYSILTAFSSLATTVEHLRRFSAAMYASAAKSQDFSSSASRGSFGLTRARRTTRTLEAFSEAVDVRIRAFEAWCAAEEETLAMAQTGIGPPLVCSLLNLRSRLEDAFSGAFDVLLKTTQAVVQQSTRSPEPVSAVWTFPDLPKRVSPGAIATLLLNALLQDVQDATTTGNAVTSRILLRVFCDAVAPCWNMLHRWLKEGMPIRDAALGAPRTPGTLYLELDEEFFIEDNELVLLDPDFWAECFVLRDSHLDERSASVPDFLVHIAPHILAAGKATGLLRALGTAEPWAHPWPSFGVLMELLDDDDDDARAPSTPASALLDFPKLVYDKLLPLCDDAQQRLSQLLVAECDVWAHLAAMEALYLMRRGDVMATFLDALFARMDSALPWTDFHFLNTAFADVVAAAGTPPWLDPALVRFSYRGSSSKDRHPRAVRAMEGLQVEYAVPFPLTYIWGPRALQVYSAVFVFVLQIHRAKSTLERILVRHRPARVGAEMKMFYAMRGKFSWFINVLLNFICTNVLHAQVLAFHELFKEAKSLDEMIKSHDDHLRKLEMQCLLQTNTTALHQALLAILEMTLRFSASFVAFAGDTTHDISRHHAVAPIKSHRSRRLKRVKTNVIGFSQTLPVASDSSSDSDSDADDADYSSATAPSFSLAASSFDEDDCIVRLDTMSSELDTLVRFVRKGVESLAAGTGEAASAFGMFAFALEDWDS